MDLLLLEGEGQTAVGLEDNNVVGEVAFDRKIGPPATSLIDRDAVAIVRPVNRQGPDNPEVGRLALLD